MAVPKGDTATCGVVEQHAKKAKKEVTDIQHIEIVDKDTWNSLINPDLMRCLQACKEEVSFKGVWLKLVKRNGEKEYGMLAGDEFPGGVAVSLMVSEPRSFENCMLTEAFLKKFCRGQ